MRRFMVGVAVVAMTCAASAADRPSPGQAEADFNALSQNFRIIAIAQTERGLRCGIVALRAVSVITAAAGVVVMPVVPEIGIPELAVGVGLLGVIGLWRTSESRVAENA